MSVGLRTLVLSQDYTPITVFPISASTVLAEDAIKLVLKNACRIVENYERKVLTPSRDDLFWPSIIVNQVPMKNKQFVRLSNETLFWRDRGICQYCAKKLTIKTLTKDHVNPTSKGGNNDWKNVVAACEGCNLKKAAQSPRGPWQPKQFPYQPSFNDLLKIRSEFPIIVDDERWMHYLGIDWQAKIVVRTPHTLSMTTKKKMKWKYNRLSALMTESESEMEVLE